MRRNGPRAELPRPRDAVLPSSARFAGAVGACRAHVDRALTPVHGHGGGLRRCREGSGGGAGLVGGRGLVAAPGVAAAGVVPDEPAEHLAAAGRLVGPGGVVLQDLAFEGGVERLREGVVGAGPDGAHGLGHAQVGAQPGVVLGRVGRPVIGVEDRPGEAAPGGLRRR